jgi:hypothetical protein
MPQALRYRHHGPLKDNTGCNHGADAANQNADAIARSGACGLVAPAIAQPPPQISAPVAAPHGLGGVFPSAIHLAFEFSQWSVLFGLRAPLGTISTTRLYAHMLAIVDEPQALFSNRCYDPLTIPR